MSITVSMPGDPTAVSDVVPPNFFLSIRASLFHGIMTQEQVDGISAILLGSIGMDKRWIAYMLATVFREAGMGMQPVREIGLGRGKPYGTKYYGRGLVQLTWLYNYQRFAKLLGINLVGNPDLALDPRYAVTILVSGMNLGLYTGKKLSDYFSSTVSDPLNARRIINGTNAASLIEGYYNDFLKALG
jgi:putative chitinase